jgi:hypothetical protein
VGRQWIDSDVDFFELHSTEADGHSCKVIVADFFNLKVELAGPLLQELLMWRRDLSQFELYIKMHHVLGDGITFGRIIDRQFREAFGSYPAPSEEPPLLLKMHPNPQKRSPLAFAAPCDSLWTPLIVPSDRFGVLFFEIPKVELHSWSKRNNLSYGVLLIVALLETCAEWNISNGEMNPMVGLMLPHNNRTQLISGLGHGTGRIRVFRNYERTLSFLEKMQNVDQQIHWSRSHGEWSLPKMAWARFVPLWILKWLVNKISDSPRFDIGTVLFTYLEGFSIPALVKTVPAIEKVFGMTPTTNRLPLTLSATDHRDTTHFALSYDQGRLPDAYAERFRDLLLREIAVPLNLSSKT